jgi:hypothetical protein
MGLSDVPLITNLLRNLPYSSPPLGTTFGNILNKTANLQMPSQGPTI